jgi:hypothetical protein
MRSEQRVLVAVMAVVMAVAAAGPIVGQPYDLEWGMPLEDAAAHEAFEVDSFMVSEDFKEWESADPEEPVESGIVQAHSGDGTFLDEAVRVTVSGDEERGLYAVTIYFLDDEGKLAITFPREVYEAYEVVYGEPAASIQGGVQVFSWDTENTKIHLADGSSLMRKVSYVEYIHKEHFDYIESGGKSAEDYGDL